MTEKRKRVAPTLTKDAFEIFKAEELKKHPLLNEFSFEIISIAKDYTHTKVFQKNMPGMASGILAAVFVFHKKYPQVPTKGRLTIILKEKQIKGIIKRYFQWCLPDLEKHKNIEALLKKPKEGEKIALFCTH